MGIPPARQSYEMNIYTPEAILDPYPHYRRLRQLGPVVWLSPAPGVRPAALYRVQGGDA